MVKFKKVNYGAKNIYVYRENANTNIPTPAINPKRIRLGFVLT